MTTGQRIAAKRKELQLSQEALGEALGVSRQSIYKWESDSSLPDIDKLIALSRLFRVSVGWLLGVEDEKPSAGALSEEQLKLIEELFRRYQQPQPAELNPDQRAQVETMVAQQLAAQPKPKKRRWPYVLACVVFLSAGFSLFDRLERMDNQYNNLQNSIGNITSNVNSQINSITNRVEEVLKAQNELTADYGTQFVAADLARNTVTFSARVVPKTYVEGMEVVFLADSGDGPAEYPAELGPGRTFTGEITSELTDTITLSAVFVTDGVRQTQLLDTYGGLYGASLPGVDISGLETAFLHDVAGKDGLFHLPSVTGWLRRVETETKMGTVEVQSIQVGLFKNFQLVTWLEPWVKPQGWSVDAEAFYRLPEMDIRLEKGDRLHFAAVFTDQYGRQGVGPSIPVFECFGDEISWTDDSDGTPYFAADNYTF